MSPFGEDARVITDSKCSKCFYSRFSDERDRRMRGTIGLYRLGLLLIIMKLLFFVCFLFLSDFRVFFRV